MQTSLYMTMLQANPMARFLRSGETPSAVWDFSSGYYTKGWSLTRNSTAHWFDTMGNLNTASVDVPRFVPTVAGRALVVEAGSTNLIDALNRTYINLDTVEVGETAGGMEFTSVSSSSSGSYLQFNGVDISSLSVGQGVNLSMVIRENSDSFALWLGIGTTGAGRVRCSVDPSALSATISQDVDNTGATAELISLGGGNLRVSVSGALISSEASELIRIHEVSGTMQYAHPQVEAQNKASTVIPGNFQGAVRAADQLTFEHADGTYTAVVRRADGSDTEIAATVIGGTWSPPNLFGDILSIALYA